MAIGTKTTKDTWWWGLCVVVRHYGMPGCPWTVSSYEFDQSFMKDHHSSFICSPLTVCLLMMSLLFLVISGNSMTYLPGSRAKWTRQASLKIMIIDSRGEIWIVLKFTSTDPHLITLMRGSPYQKRDKNTQQITLALYISTHNILCPFFSQLKDSILATSLKRRLNNTEETSCSKAQRICKE